MLVYTLQSGMAEPDVQPCNAVPRHLLSQGSSLRRTT